MEDKLNTSGAMPEGAGAEAQGDAGLIAKIKSVLGIGTETKGAEGAGKAGAETEAGSAGGEEKKGTEAKDADGEKALEGDAGKEAKTYSQAELDAAKEAARRELLEEQKAAAEEKKRLEKMSPEERAQDAVQKEKERAEKLSAELTRLKLEREAGTMLSEAKLPAGLSGMLNYESEEKLKESVAAVGKVFHEALEAAVTERLKGKTPKGLGAAGSVADSLITAEISKRINGGF